MTRACFGSVVAILCLVGCGGAQAGEEGGAEVRESAGGESGALAETIPSPPMPWEEMSHEDQGAWMAQEVMPRLGPMFEQYDPERYAGFTCQGCHGASAQERGFEMPNPDIMALHPTGTPEQQQMVQDHPEMVRFMFTKVLPTMQTLLGASPYDEATQTGFSCYACHPSAGGEVAAFRSRR